MRRASVLLLVAPLLAVGCARGREGPGSTGEDIEEARTLVEQGAYDDALARLGDGADAESLYLLGLAWAGKARQAGGVGGDRLGPEETQALAFLERAVRARPDHAAAHLAIAEILAPHAATPETGATGAAVAPVSGVSVDRVLGAYGAAVQADLADTEAVEGLIAFATRVGRLPEVEAGYRELTRRDRENAVVLVRFGDFLAGPGQDPEEALGIYAQALMWRPDDDATRLKMVDINIEAARGHLELDHYAAAEARLREARKYVGSSPSPQARRLREIEARLADASGRR
jgi:tetratricopeptide (TPR) repeat protein